MWFVKCMCSSWKNVKTTLTSDSSARGTLNTVVAFLEKNMENEFKCLHQVPSACWRKCSETTKENISQMFPAASFQSFGAPCWILPWPLSQRLLMCAARCEGSQREQDWWTWAGSALSFHLEQTSGSGLLTRREAGEVAQLHIPRAVEASGGRTPWNHYCLNSCRIMCSCRHLPSAWLAAGRGSIAPVSLPAPSKLFLCGAIAVNAGCQHKTCHCSAGISWH